MAAWIRALGCGLCLLAVGGGPAAAGLAEQLARGETVTIVALGDSLVVGWELPNAARDAYPRVFRSLLQRRYREAHIRLVDAGVPGNTAAAGRSRLARDVLRQNPDLVIVQFGGNDHGGKRSPEAFRRDLEQTIRRIREAGPAAVLLATPPIAEPETDTPMVRVVKEVGQAHAVPVADFDGALRQAGTGPRGSFPMGRHPTAWMHAVMGRELYRAFTLLADEGERLRVSIHGGVREVARGAPLEIPVYVKAAGPGPVLVALERDDLYAERRVTADAEGRATARFTLPTTTLPPHTRQQRLLAWARQGDDFACDLRWLNIAPVLQPGYAQGSLGSERVLLGARQWRSLADLSGRFQVEYAKDALLLTVTVRDDRLQRSYQREPHQSDGVELYLDLRPPGAQGRPYWDEGVLGLCFRPATTAREEPAWSSLEPLPPSLPPIGLESTRRADGYEIRVRLPLALLRRYLAPGQQTIGFDLALNDADDPWGRQSQMVWSGTVDNYLDPSAFGALSFRRRPDGKPGLRVVVR
ncbi:MAG: hypothetical protein GX774_08930 [Armatimonadetes bacterium]|nr:hypothetical protein [Armatimonadota bacterium]